MVSDPLIQYLLQNSRPMTNEERIAYSGTVEKLSKPTGRKVYDFESINCVKN